MSWLTKLFKKPEFAAVLKLGRPNTERRDDLPEDTPPLGVKSGYSDGMGLVTLRSQTPQRHPSEQIAATLKYGTHGGYHGHFDRTAFNSMLRHDRSFYEVHQPIFHDLYRFLPTVEYYRI